MDPVTTRVPGLGTSSPNFAQSIVPTHTFETAPQLDVLIVPGGFGNRAPGLESLVNFIKERYPTVRYFISVCTGSGLAARAGILDGKRATTNKRAWAEIIRWGPDVNWIAHARWVKDGNIWTSSGVSAGIDVSLAWVEAVYGSETASWIANGMEYERHQDSTNDPFAKLYNLPGADNPAE